ncbi:leupaxin-like isoform X1 [Haliotis rubra]|uniref:leupaxin-like isoform X1 n=2 Tax=Haliotis rubra TaxID=36100 RepID=UPI001EE626E4|nr:leupaxin-like isoform X1 [Haliotis rubra]
MQSSSTSSGSSKQQRVMDDLDALLADLQSTTQNISTYQHQINPPAQVITNTNRDSSASSRDSRSSTPPLPPPPPVEVLDSLPPPRGHDQPIYEPQNFRMRETTPTSDTSQSSDLASLPDKGRQQQGMSQLSSNLSELDQLLQDLNSAQFLSEVEKKSSGGKEPIVNGTGRAPPPVAPKPTRPSERATVESLLDELEVSVPSHHGAGNDLGHYSGPTSPHGQVRGGPPAPNGHPGDAPPTPGASTATKELDDLMASLSEFKLQNKPQQASVEPAYAKPNKGTGRQVTPTSPMNPSIPSPNQLETMLGDLQSDMNKQGVSTKTKGVCAACNQPVVGQVITALGKIWHLEHFTCSHCNDTLGTKNFYERDNQAFCERDYHELFAPRCGYCSGPIVDKCITALGKTWHPEHFFCTKCGRPFGEEGFHEKDGKAYCRDDYYEMFAPKCGGCCNPIMDNYITALNRHWHPECFVCWDCRSPFGGGSFFDHEGLPYCETHYHLKRGSLYASCQKPITGRCITAMFKKFHPEHFVCAFCLKQLNKGTFKDQGDKPYCHPCFVKLFG